jgi:hypothetical protein
MHWFRTGLAAVVAAVACLTVPPAGAAGSRPQELYRGHCWYRVYYRVCQKNPWCYYATYNDCHRAQGVVDYLHFQGCEAYYRLVAPEPGT